MMKIEDGDGKERSYLHSARGQERQTKDEDAIQIENAEVAEEDEIERRSHQLIQNQNSNNNNNHNNIQELGHCCCHNNYCHILCCNNSNLVLNNTNSNSKNTPKYHHHRQQNGELIQDIRSRMILHWNYRNLSEFPQELLDNGHHVREIYLKRNSIINLPKDVGKLENLTNIYLSGNQLCSLPDEIGQLVNLEVLDVSQNSLQTLPRSVGNLRKLQTLILTHNQLHYLPLEMKKLRNLHFLELSDNQLGNGALDEEIIHGLEALEELCIDRNPIKSLPRNLALSPKLRAVSACRCDLRFLPGLPFFALIHGNHNHRRSTNNNNNTLNYNEEQELNFQFRFDENPNLNYIPYWMLQFFGPRLESFGSGGGNEGSNGFDFFRIDLPHILYTWESQMGRLKKMNKIFFYFDKSIKKVQSSKCNNSKSSESKTGSISNNNNDCLSLLEICLRNIFVNREIKSNSQREMELLLELPSHLSKLLIIGPTCQCFECMTPIFTVEWPLIFKLQTVGDVPIEASELLYPRHGVINAYNHFQLNERLRTGEAQGFHYGIIYFCNFRCKQRFIQTITASNFLPFHDFKLIVQNEI